MESPKTKILLEKYWEGHTTLEEEALLVQHFSGELPKEAEKYSPIFDYRQHLKGEEMEVFDLSFLEEDVKLKTTHRIGVGFNNWKNWTIGIAASIVLAIFSVSYQWPHTQTLQAKSMEMEKAYSETLATLTLIANKLNVGTESIQEISVFDQTTKHIIHEK